MIHRHEVEIRGRKTDDEIQEISKVEHVMEEENRDQKYWFQTILWNNIMKRRKEIHSECYPCHSKRIPLSQIATGLEMDTKSWEKITNNYSDTRILLLMVKKRERMKLQMRNPPGMICIHEPFWWISCDPVTRTDSIHSMNPRKASCSSVRISSSNYTYKREQKHLNLLQ